MEWRLEVTRNLSPLFYEFISAGQAKDLMKEILGVDFYWNHFRAVERRVSYTAHEIEAGRAAVKKSFTEQGTKFFKTLLEKWYSFNKEIEALTLEISKKDYSSYSNEMLIKELDRLVETYHKCSTALYAPLFIERIADQVIKDHLKKHTDKVKEYFNILTTPEKENEGTDELKAMLRMAIRLKKGEDISSDVKKHIQKYGWINTRGFYGDGWSESEIMERLRSMQEPEKTLRKLENHTAETKAETAKVLSEIDADDEFRAFIDVVKEYVYFRTLRMDVFVKNGFRARPLLREIAKRINLDLQDVIHLLSSEIKSALKDGRDFRDEVDRRRNGFAYVMDEHDLVVYSGDDLEKYKAEHVREETVEDTGEVKGVMANPGKVQGVVKVLVTVDDVGKVGKGDILVASMTFPSYIAAMEKAAAFVTDEGGILCHAAIISRELGKPCVIGTQVATKMFKDGDVVEVDADNGVVRKV
jgi:phosphoenolpyruvate synthase/pyruvate phosphate dikinase